MSGGFWKKRRDKSGADDVAGDPDLMEDVPVLPPEFQDQDFSSVAEQAYDPDPEYDQAYGEQYVEPDTGHAPDDFGGSDAPDVSGTYDNQVEYDRIYPRSPAEAIQPEAAPLPPSVKRKQNRIVRALNGIIAAIIFFLLIGAGIMFVGFRQFTAVGPLTETRNIVIPHGDSLTSIATRLEREGVIVDAYMFLAGVSVARASNQLKAGEYLFRENMSMRDVMQTLIEGKSILHGVTLPEGRTSLQIVEILRADPILLGEITDIPPEGSLLPETYKFTRGDERQTIITRMHQAQERALERIWANRDTSIPIQSPEDLVILASIVEKETGRADERPQVAAVFVNRLNRGIRLQSDPTIIYGIVGGQGTLGRPIRRSEIDAATPYNTYQIDGLPPTPIANPGIAALEATANPSQTSDLFFVADGTGGHAFAETLAGHQQNVRRWRQYQAQAAAAAPATPDPTDAPDPDTGASSENSPAIAPPLPEINLNLSLPLILPPTQ